MPIYKMEGKKNGLQKYRVRVNYTDSSGKAKQIDRVAYGKEQAKDLERQLNRDLREETVRKITLQVLYDEYIKSKSYEVRETTLDRTKHRLEYYVLPMLKDYRIDRLSTALLQKWKLSMEERTTGKSGNGLSLKTKQNVYGEFRALLNYSVKMEYLSKNPLLNIGNFRNAYEGKHEMAFYTPEEFKKFIAATKTNAEQSEKMTGNIHEWNYHVFFMIAFYTGMRKGEINALKWTDLWDNTIHVTRSIAQKLKGGDRETPPKNKSSIRDIQVPVPLKEALNAHLNRFKSICGFCYDWRICGGEKCIRDSTIEKRNTLYSETAGVKRIRIHDFRHPYVKLKLKNNLCTHSCTF